MVAIGSTSDHISGSNKPSGNNPSVILSPMANPQPDRLNSIHTLFPSLSANKNNPGPNSHIPGFNLNIPLLDLVSPKGVIMHISDRLTRSPDQLRVRPVT